MLDRRVGELKRIYSEVISKTLPDGTGLIKVLKAGLPLGCSPPATDLLLTFSTNQDAPSGRYVKDPIRLANGNTPSYSPTIIDGESWNNFSYNFQWNPSKDPMYQYVESMLTRFAKSA